MATLIFSSARFFAYLLYTWFWCSYVGSRMRPLPRLLECLKVSRSKPPCRGVCRYEDGHIRPSSTLLIPLLTPNAHISRKYCPWSPCFCFLRLHLQMCSTGSLRSFMDGSRRQPLRLPFMFVLCSNTCRPTRTFRKLLRYLMHPSSPEYVRLPRWQKCVQAGFGPTRAMSRFCRQWTMTNLFSLTTSLVYAKDEILKLLDILLQKILRD